MGVIADLVVSVKADVSGFSKDLKAKLGQAGKGASVPVSGGGRAVGGVSTADMIGAGAILMGIYGIMKKVVAPITASSKFLQLFFDYTRNSIGVAMDMMIFSLLAGFHVLKPIVKPIIGLFEAFGTKMIPVFTDLLDFTKTTLNDNMAMISTLLETVVGGALRTMSTTWTTTIGPLFKTMVGFVADNLPILNTLAEIFFKVQENIMKIAGPVLNLLMTTITDNLTSMGELLSPVLWLISKAMDIVAPGIDRLITIMGFISDAFDFVKNSLNDVVTNTYNSIASQVPFLKKISTNTDDMANTLNANREEAMAIRYQGGLDELRQKGLGEEVRRLLSMGLTAKEIVESFLEDRKRRQNEARGAAAGFQTNGTGGLVIPQDYWGNAYDGIGTGSWQ